MIVLLLIACLCGADPGAVPSAAPGIFGIPHAQPAGLVKVGEAHDAIFDAVCRVRVRGGTGSGCVFEVSQGFVYVLTCGHVTDRNAAASCDFFNFRPQATNLPGQVVAQIETEAFDAAVIAIPAAAFGDAVPPAVPIAAAAFVPAAGAEVFSAGCAKGAWPTMFRGRVLRYDPSLAAIYYEPPPLEGRSGSALIDATSRQIVGIVRARTKQQPIVGVASPVAALYAAMRGRCPPGQACPPRGQPGQPGQPGPCNPVQPQPFQPWPTPVPPAASPLPTIPDPQLRPDSGPSSPLAEKDEWRSRIVGVEEDLGRVRGLAEAAKATAEAALARGDTADRHAAAAHTIAAKVESRTTIVEQSTARERIREIAADAAPKALDLLLPAALTALGVSGPVGVIAVFGAQILARRVARRRQKPPRGSTDFGTRPPPAASEVSANREATPPPIVIRQDTPPPPQEVVTERRFVPYQAPSIEAEALRFGHEEYVRRYPGARSMVETVEEFARQYAAGRRKT